MVLNLLSDGAAAIVIANSLDIPVQIVDAGITGDPIDHPNLINRRIARTVDFSVGPAMTSDQYLLAKSHEPRSAKTSQPTTSASVKSSSLTPHPHPSSPTKSSAFRYLNSSGPAPDLTTPGVQHKLAVLTKAAERTASHLDAQTALTEYGGFEIAMMAAAIQHSANAQRIVIIDGFIATAAAIATINSNPTITNALVFAHRSGERGHDAMLEALNVHPLLDLDMRLGEGTGALLAWPIIKSAAAVLNEMATFDSAPSQRQTLILAINPSPLMRPLQRYRGSPVHGGNVRRTKGAVAG